MVSCTARVRATTAGVGRYMRKSGGYGIRDVCNVMCGIKMWVVLGWLGLWMRGPNGCDVMCCGGAGVGFAALSSDYFP